MDTAVKDQSYWGGQLDTIFTLWKYVSIEQVLVYVVFYLLQSNVSPLYWWTSFFAISICDEWCFCYFYYLYRWYCSKDKEKSCHNNITVEVAIAVVYVLSLCSKFCSLEGIGRFYTRRKYGFYACRECAGFQNSTLSSARHVYRKAHVFVNTIMSINKPHCIINNSEALW